MRQQQQPSIHNSLPYDIAFTVASSLPARDVCALGSCSRYWQEMCGSDGLWEILFRLRWPHPSSPPPPQLSGWKGIYKKRHNETADKALTLIKTVEKCSPTESLEVVDYLSAIRDLSLMKFEFKDVQMFLFKSKLNVLLNLVGLHHCITSLEVPADQLLEALDSSGISEREVFARWWKLGRRFRGFRLRDETRSCQFSLREFATYKEEEILAVLHRGVVHEVLRVQISVAKPLSTPWSCQSSQSLV